MLLLFAKGGRQHAWRFDYRFAGKRNMLLLGSYPDTALAIAQARVEREAQGLPPIDSFEAVAREWFAVKRDGWAAGYADKIVARFEAECSRGSAGSRSQASRRRNCSRC